MTRQPAPAPSIARLAEALVSGTLHGQFAAELERWMTGSRPFHAFVEANQAKIHKKLRGARDGDALADLRAELLAARLLLADRRIALGFEATGARAGGPDFTATFRAGRPFNIEVTRLRRPPDATTLGRVLLAKLQQLPPSVPNILVVKVSQATAIAEVEAATRTFRVRADARDEAFFGAHGLAGARGFYDRYLRLGAVILWCEAAAAGERAARWTSASARIAVPERAATACVEALDTGV